MQRLRLSIGGADARHFHPITGSGSGSKHCNDAGGSVVSSEDTGSGPASIPDDAGRAVGHGARVTKRVLRVHTGGKYDSNVSLPVPLCVGEGTETPGRVAEGGRGGGTAVGDTEEGVGVRADREGARSNGKLSSTVSKCMTCSCLLCVAVFDVLSHVVERTSLLSHVFDANIAVATFAVLQIYL